LRCCAGVQLRDRTDRRRRQWRHSYVAADKTFCVYLAENEDAVRKHSELSGIPANTITEIPQIIDPVTANN
jgi:hypothetical protein